MSFDYDLFVIGGGSGGVRAARLTAEDGFRVGLAEEYRMGGTCVIRGCVPKKLMVYASEYSSHFEDAAGYGWRLGEIAFDWDAFKAARDAEIDRLEGLYRANLARAGVEIFDARARLIDPHTVEVGGRKVTAKHILVATGGVPFVPEFPGSEHVITSNEVFHLPELPKRMLVVGGGYIACEFASIFNGLGVHVTQFYRGAQILRGFDDELRGHLAEEMQRRGVDLHVGTDVEFVRRQENGSLFVKSADGREWSFDVILYATGRRPNTAGLGLEAAGVETGRFGEIRVDDYGRSSVPSVFAVGDVTNRVNLTPVAIREAVAFVETVFRGNPTPADHELVPTAVFTQPELGTVGKTEEEARDERPVEVYLSAFRPMRNILAGRKERMLMKMIVCSETRQVMGVHLAGPAAAEMIQLAGVALGMGATKEDFDRTIAVHPTAAEELVLMKKPVRSW